MEIVYYLLPVTICAYFMGYGGIQKFELLYVCLIDFGIGSFLFCAALVVIGKKHALKKYDQFAAFGGSIGSKITPVVQFHEIFVTEIMNKLI